MEIPKMRNPCGTGGFGRTYTCMVSGKIHHAIPPMSRNTKHMRTIAFVAVLEDDCTSNIEKPPRHVPTH